MLQGFRIGLQPGVTGTYKWAIRPENYSYFNQWNTGDNGGFWRWPDTAGTWSDLWSYLWQKDPPSTNYTIGDPTSSDYVTGVPTLNRRTNEWGSIVWTYQGASRNESSGMESADTQFWSGQILVAEVLAALDPCMEPDWSETLPIPQSGWIPAPNVWEVRLQVSDPTGRTNNWYQENDTGKFGWVSGVYGPDAFDVYFGEFQWINFTKQQVFIPRHP